tara:strand:+ start:319 stop:750 length:432 start_codon:yes stop_codon:yes gene_type:complete
MQASAAIAPPETADKPSPPFTGKNKNSPGRNIAELAPDAAVVSATVVVPDTVSATVRVVESPKCAEVTVTTVAGELLTNVADKIPGSPANAVQSNSNVLDTESVYVIADNDLPSTVGVIVLVEAGSAEKVIVCTCLTGAAVTV